jgi:hypothetical protein
LRLTNTLSGMPGRWRKVFKLDPQQIIYISHIPEPERGIWLPFEKGLCDTDITLKFCQPYNLTLQFCSAKLPRVGVTNGILVLLSKYHYIANVYTYYDHHCYYTIPIQYLYTDTKYTMLLHNYNCFALHTWSINPLHCDFALCSFHWSTSKVH